MAEPGDIELIERFTEGDCHIFARELNKLTGFPIYTFDGGLHAFVMTPDGKCVDIEGVHTVKAFRKKWYTRSEMTPHPWRKLRSEWGGNQFERSYAVAREEAPKIAKLLEKPC